MVDAVVRQALRLDPVRKLDAAYPAITPDVEDDHAMFPIEKCNVMVELVASLFCWIDEMEVGVAFFDGTRAFGNLCLEYRIGLLRVNQRHEPFWVEKLPFRHCDLLALPNARCVTSRPHRAKHRAVCLC